MAEQEPKVRTAADDLKVVISVTSGIATVGVQKPDTDPHFESFAHMELSDILTKVVGVFERATDKWSEEPRYPAHEGAAQPALTPQTAPTDEDNKSEQKQATLF